MRTWLTLAAGVILALLLLAGLVMAMSWLAVMLR